MKIKFILFIAHTITASDSKALTSDIEYFLPLQQTALCSGLDHVLISQ